MEADPLFRPARVFPRHLPARVFPRHLAARAFPRHLAARAFCGYLAGSLLLGLMGCVAATSAVAAGFRTQNFIVEASTPQLAQMVGEAAERYRHDLAVHWLGGPLRDWPTPCPVRVVDGPRLAAQGITQYDRAPVGNFMMEVVGTQQRILDSVLPHEVTHTVLATHFGRPLPRWADEGICSTVEHESERAKHEAKLREFLRTRRGIAMNQLFLLKEYPNDVLPMYAQGYSVCRFLIEQRGPRQFIAFLHDYMQRPSWTENIRKHYGYESLGELQEYWLTWVSDGSGPVERFAKHSLPAPAAGPTESGRTPAPATRLAAAQADSFYLRNRDGLQDRGRTGSANGLIASKGDRIGSPPPTPASEPPAPSRLQVAAANGEQPPRPDLANVVLAAPGRDSAAPGGDSAAPGGDSVPQRSPVPRTLIPPSVRDSGRYSVSQPQPEQGGPSGETNVVPWAGQSEQRWR